MHNPQRDEEKLTNWVGVVPAEETVRAEAVLLTRRHRDEVLAKEVQPAVDNLKHRIRARAGMSAMPYSDARPRVHLRYDTLRTREFCTSTGWMKKNEQGRPGAEKWERLDVRTGQQRRGISTGQRSITRLEARRTESGMLTAFWCNRRTCKVRLGAPRLAICA